MASGNNTDVGLAEQTAKGTINSTDNEFTWFTFMRGGIAPNNVIIPQDDGVGGGALPPGVDKVGIYSAGAFEFTPRPVAIGHFLKSALGRADTADANGNGYDHVFGFQAADEYALPWYTFRSKPGGLWGETFKDCHLSDLTLTWRAADRLRGSMTVVGGTPTPNVTTTTWSPSPDLTPTFLAPTTTVTWDVGTLKIMRGQISFGNAIPLEEQWITGSYAPENFDVVTRAISVQMLIKVDDVTLYERMQYDPAGTATAWTAETFKKADWELVFKSADEFATGEPYMLSIKANDSSSAPNVVWTAAPIQIQSGRIISMLVSGTYLKSTDGDDITVTLTNEQATDY